MSQDDELIANAPQAIRRQSLKARLEESIVWVAGGCFVVGIGAGVTLGKDVPFVKNWLNEAKDQSATRPTQSSEPVRLSGPIAKKWTSGPILGVYQQVSATGVSSCNTCTLELRSVTLDQLAIETNNGVIGSVYFDTESKSWLGHVQFTPESHPAAKRLIILVKMKMSGENVEIAYAPIGEAAFSASYSLMK